MEPTFTHSRRVQFAETDLAGIMHFANYFRWMEEAEHAWFRSMGLCVIQPTDDGVISWPRVRTSCEYFGPVRFEDEVEIHLQVTDVTEKSITYDAYFLHGGRKTAHGRTKMVCCRMEGKTFSSISIPDFMRAKLASAKP